MIEPLVVVTSKMHEPRMHVHKILLDHSYNNWIMIVDSEEQKQRAMSLGIPATSTDPYPVDIPPQDRIAWKREWIESHIVPLNSWYVTLDDNIRGWTYLPLDKDWIDLDVPPEGTSWRKLFATEMPFAKVIEAWNSVIKECENRHTLLGGFSIENNHFFRAYKWQTLGYVRTSNAVIKNTGLPFYYWRGAMLEDFCRTVDVVSRTGSILINRHVKPIKTFFEPGGIGSFEERRPNLEACCDELMRRYPGLLRRVKGREWSLTFKSRAAVEAWRQMNA